MGESEGSVDDRAIQHEEVGRDIAASGVITTEGSDEYGGLAGGVLLVVDAALGEDGALVLADDGLDLGVEAVLEDEPGVEDTLECDEDLAGAGMGMGDVETAGLDHGDGRGDAETGESRPVLDSSEEDGASLRAGTGALVVVVEDHGLAEGGTREELSIGIGEQLIKALDG